MKSHASAIRKTRDILLDTAITRADRSDHDAIKFDLNAAAEDDHPGVIRCIESETPLPLCVMHGITRGLAWRLHDGIDYLGPAVACRMNVA